MIFDIPSNLDLHQHNPRRTKIARGKDSVGNISLGEHQLKMELLQTACRNDNSVLQAM